jgi:mRNA interferase MazF
MDVVVSRFEVYLVNLEPTVGREIRKTRPALIISPDEMNHAIGTIIIAPMTTKGRACPTRVPVTFQGKKGYIVLDQIRTVGKKRLVRRWGRITPSAAQKILGILAETFAP